MAYSAIGASYCPLLVLVGKSAFLTVIRLPLAFKVFWRGKAIHSSCWVVLLGTRCLVT